MKHTAPRAAALCLVGTLAAGTPAQADPTSLEDALANVLVATLWHAVGLPTLGGDIESSAGLETTLHDPGGLLLTLSTPPQRARSLTTLVCIDGIRDPQSSDGRGRDDGDRPFALSLR